MAKKGAKKVIPKKEKPIKAEAKITKAPLSFKETIITRRGLPIIIRTYSDGKVEEL